MENTNYDFRFENFKSVYDFEKALTEREVNDAFKKNCASHRNGDESWFQTGSYSEADELLTKGWNAKIDEVKSACEKFATTVVVKHRRLINDYVGFMPSVPRAIQGYPQSMINMTKRDSLEMQRTKHIVFDNTACGGTSGNSLLQAGLTVLKLAMILDKSNVRTKIDMLPFTSYAGNSFYGCSVTIKDYRQPFNYLKMAYPIANPSFFRRHGFRWIETQSGKNVEKFSYGYGGEIFGRGEATEAYLKFAGLKKDDVIFINHKDCREADFNPETLMKNKGIK
jgi:hypothetical protein